MIRLALIVPLTATLLCAAHAARPVYFVASGLPATCAVLGEQSPLISSTRLDFLPGGQHVEFPGARSGIPCILEKSEPRFSTFVGNKPSGWRTHLPLSRRIRFPSIYDGIDLVYYGNGSRLEYDFEIAPGAAPSQIRLSFAEGSELSISPEGELLVSHEGSTLIQHRPVVRQGSSKVVAHYVIDRIRRQVRIALGPYNRALPLTIDPVLSWQTHSSPGSNLETVSADAGGNMWILAGFPLISGPLTTKFGPGGDVRNVLIVKIDPTGAKVLYAVLIGGSNTEFASGLAIDNDGNAFITGLTDSSDFPVTAQAFQTTAPSLNGGAAFVVKLSPQGDSLVYSTYLGGSGGAAGEAIAVDNAGNATVTGTVIPPDFPLTAGSWEDHFSTYPLSVTYALRPIAGGFVTRLNSTGSALIYSTLVDVMPGALVLNSSGAAYVAGASVAYLPALTTYTLSVGSTAASGTVVTRITPDGAKADLSIFIACMPFVFSHAGLIALDSSNDILVGGSTACATFPAGTSGAFQPAHASLSGSISPYDQTAGYDGIVVKIAPDASSILAATYLGGGDTDQIQALAVASDDSVMVGGGTSSSNFPVTDDALQPKYSGGAIPQAMYSGDGFFSRLSPDLKRLEYSTYLGGAGADFIEALALDLVDNAYLGGFTSSAVPNVGGAFSSFPSGTIWSLKLGNDATHPPAISSVSPASVTAGTSGAVVQISGSGFAQNCVLLANGSQRQTAFTSDSQLSVTLTAADLALSGTIELRALNSASGASDPWLLPVIAPSGQNPYPRIKALLPDSLPAGSPAQNFTVTGAGFLSSSVASVNGSARTTILNSDGSLGVSLTAMDLAAPGAPNVTVGNPAPGGGVSKATPFTVSSPVVPAPPPALSSNGASVPAGTAVTTFEIAGSGFTPTLVARWNGVAHPIIKDSSGATAFTATAADLAHAGTAELTLYDTATGLESNAVPFWISSRASGMDMAWNPANQFLYLSGTNSLIVLDPASGDSVATVSTDTQLGRLEISPDGGYLFALTSAGILRRYPLSAGAPWAGASMDLPVSNVIDFLPVTGSPGSVAVYLSAFPQTVVAIYDGVTKRPSTAQIPSASAARALQFSGDGQTLYYAAGYSSVVLSTMPVSSAGAGAAVTIGGAANTAVPATVSQGRIYTSFGAVFDLTTLAQIGSVPASTTAPPLVSSQALIMLVDSSQGLCSLQAFDPIALIPLWEEHIGGGCASNYYPYSRLFNIGGGKTAFSMTNAYIVKQPGAAPLHSIYPLTTPFSATLEVGTVSWAPQNELAVLSAQTSLPVTAFLLQDQPNVLTFGGAAYEQILYSVRSTPNYFSFSPFAGILPPLGQYTGKAELLISNTSNPPLVVPYTVTFANPYPLQGSVSSLAFTWHVGDNAPAAQSFSVTKQGSLINAGFQGLPYPAWLTYSSNGYFEPQTITIAANPTGLAPGIYQANVQIGYYSSSVPNLAIPVTLTVTGNAPAIANVQDAESARTTVVSGEWIAIYGAGLAVTTRAWASTDFPPNGTLPATLDGVTVTFGSTPAAVYYVSPTQIDAQVPAGLSGSTPVTVALNGVSGASFAATVVPQAPSLYVYPAGSSLYPAATHLDGTLVGDPAVQPGATPAKAGEKSVLYVNGLTASQAGTLIQTPVPFTGDVTVTVGAERALCCLRDLLPRDNFSSMFSFREILPREIIRSPYRRGASLRPGLSFCRYDSFFTILLYSELVKMPVQ